MNRVGDYQGCGYTGRPAWGGKGGAGVGSLA